jgi:TolA-binding protein
MTTPPPPDDPVWAHVRMRYEQDQETVASIAQDVGLASISLSKRAKAWGWMMRGRLKPVPKAKPVVKTKAETTTVTIKRLKDILHQRVTQLETQLKDINEEVSALSTEREIRSTNTLVRTIEKVLDLERKERQRKVKQTRDFKYFDDAQRGALADKIKRLQHEWRGGETFDQSAAAGSSGAEQPVALLGETEPAAATSGN